eukprot:6188709-Pleurochrysis_carterae.AAC.1
MLLKVVLYAPRTRCAKVLVTTRNTRPSTAFASQYPELVTDRASCNGCQLVLGRARDSWESCGALSRAISFTDTSVLL